ncbi:MAG: C4-dicarboxylate ABC transporter permease [Alphaproteobacteria bacterium HGW-Alphaproteobacteria-2]|nr:MAG: C4-dicarboxylate ABC transporter permease [Alphaproteobacteria bacterium HGW-Alphaproteobacteria-2]
MTATKSQGERQAAALAGAVALLLLGIALAWSAGLHHRLRIGLYTEQFLAMVLGLAIAHVFLTRRTARLPRVLALPADLAMAALALGGGTWLAVVYPAVSLAAAIDPASALIPAVALILTLLVALLRVAGWALTLVILAFFAYGLWGAAVPGRFQALYVAPERLAVQLALDTGGILGTPLGIAASVVVVFVAFGRLLEHLGGAAVFTDLATAAMGGLRGGAAKIAILASTLFGAVSGSAVSNVVTTGVVTIPLMQRGGFRRETAAGIEAVASTGGQLMPPVMGASAFLMAEFLNVPYANVALAALVPALLYYAALFLLADLTAARSRIAAVPASERPPLGATLRRGWPFLLPFAALVWALFALNLRPETAGLVALAALLAVAPLSPVARGRMGPRRMLGALADGGGALSQIVVITAAAGVVIGVMNETGLGFGMTSYLTQLARDEALALLFLAAILSVILGMGMPTIAVYVLLAALVAPALVRLGIEPVAAHLFVLYFGMMSMITPPVAIAAFAAASISDARPMRTALQAMVFGWPAYVLPFAFALNPALILHGGPAAVALAIATAAAGVAAVSVAIVGHLRGPLPVVPRVALVVAGGLLLLWPALTG